VLFNIAIRVFPRTLSALVLATTLAGCGGGGDPIAPPPVVIPTAAIAVGAATGTVVIGSSTTIAVTLTRGGGFTGEVALAVTGALTGVTVAAQTVAAGATTTTLNVVTTAAAVEGTQTLIIAGTGAGVTIVSQTVALMITAPVPPIAQIGSDITNGDVRFGSKIALSADGTRMVVGAPESANGTTRVYQRTGTTWAQLGADIIGEALGDLAGSGLDINTAGTRIAIGASLNDGNGTSSGHVRVYDLVGTTWTQVGADINGGAGSGLGFRVALSGSGNRLIADCRTLSSTCARVFDLVSGSWTQVGATLTGIDDFGNAVDVSSDGNTIAVSAAGSTTANTSAGSVYVYRLNGGAWTQVGNVLTGTTGLDRFGFAISLTANGTRIAISAPVNSEGAPAGSLRTFGQVRVFDLQGSTWTPVGNAVNGLSDIGTSNDALGQTLRISDDGTRWAATGTPNSIARVYTLNSGAWTQTGATIVSPAGLAGSSEGLALSPDGKTVAVGYVNGTPRRVRVFSILP
jgi:hypothetical protein